MVIIINEWWMLMFGREGHGRVHVISPSIDQMCGPIDVQSH